jgi:hypothetical protein
VIWIDEFAGALDLDPLRPEAIREGAGRAASCLSPSAEEPGDR